MGLGTEVDIHEELAGAAVTPLHKTLGIEAYAVQRSGQRELIGDSLSALADLAATG